MICIGDKKLAKCFLGDEKIQKVYHGDELVYCFKVSRLPEGYTEVEYIQSTTPAYINTGIKPTATMKFTLDIETMTDGDSTVKYIVWSRYAPSNISGTTYYSFVLRWYKDGVSIKAGSHYNTNSTVKVLDAITAARRMVITADYLNKEAFVNGGEKITVGTATSTGMNAIYLLRGISNAYALDARLYSCQIESGGSVVRDFVPCIDPSGMVGLYDLVSNAFYGNANTTGTFTPGPAV